MHKKLIYILILFPVVSLAPASILYSQYNNKTINETLNATEKPDHIVLTWSDDPVTTQTITWRAASTVTEGGVAYSEFGKSDPECVYKKAVVELFTSAAGDSSVSMNIFSVTLKGLKPGTKYSYHVECGKNSSQQYTFSTAANNTDDFEFLIFGDSQSGNVNNSDYSQWHATLYNARKRHGKAKFIVTMGDMVESGQNYIHWNNWFDAARETTSIIPLVPVEGNHETYGAKRWPYTKPYYYLKQFKVFQNGPDGLKGQVYSFDYADVHFSILDSQQDEESRHYGDILKVQSQWLDEDLSSSRKKWKLVLFHKSPYSHHPLSINREVKKAFCPIIEKHHADVVFSAHDHVIARTHPMKNDKPGNDPKEGTIYYTTGRSGAKYYGMLFHLSSDAFFYNPKDKPCYELIAINKKTLRITAYKQDGAIIDSYTIEK